MSVTYSINAHVIVLNGVLQLSGANPSFFFKLEGSMGCSIPPMTLKIYFNVIECFI
jgi:hypothetical protein